MYSSLLSSDGLSHLLLGSLLADPLGEWLCLPLFDPLGIEKPLLADDPLAVDGLLSLLSGVTRSERYPWAPLAFPDLLESSLGESE